MFHHYPGRSLSGRLPLVINTIFILCYLDTLAKTQMAYPQITKRGRLTAQSTYQQLNIQLPKLLSYPLEPLSPSDQDNLSRTNDSLKDIGSLNPIGGLGLASESQNHISLSALSKKPVHLTVRRLGATPELMSTSNKDSASKSRASLWSKLKSDQVTKPLSVRVIGQSVDPHVPASIQPDLSPGKVRKLRRILAGSLDTKWTSETPPRVLIQRGVAAVHDDEINSLNQELIAQVQRLNITISTPLGPQYGLPGVQMQLFRNWLVELASCEMEYIWEDLGPLFWPRWIRRGVCLNNKQAASCSWPPGMKCKPTGSRTLKLLHWKCDERLTEDGRRDSETPLQPTSKLWHTGASRFRRRTAKNYFHSSFQDMDPVNLEKGDAQKTVSNPASPASNIKYNERPPVGLGNRIPSDKIRLFQPRSLNIQNSRIPSWKLLRSRPTRGSLGSESRKVRRQRRARRLIKRLSVTTNGYHCSWQVQNYLVNDRCTCSCVQ